MEKDNYRGTIVTVLLLYNTNHVLHFIHRQLALKHYEIIYSTEITQLGS